MAESMMFYRIVAANSINKMFNHETGKEEYTIEEYPHVYDNYEDAYEDAFKCVRYATFEEADEFLRNKYEDNKKGV